MQERSDVWRMIAIYHTSALQECTSQTEECIHKLLGSTSWSNEHTTQAFYLVGHEGKLSRSLSRRITVNTGAASLTSS